MIEWFLIYAMKVGRETGHIVFMLFLNLGKTRGVQYLSGFCTSVSSPTLMLFYPLGNFSQTWERGKNLKDNSFSVNTLKFSEWLEGNTPTWGEVGWKSVIACSAFTSLSGQPGKTNIALALPSVEPSLVTGTIREDGKLQRIEVVW